MDQPVTLAMADAAHGNENGGNQVGGFVAIADMRADKSHLLDWHTNKGIWRSTGTHGSETQAAVKGFDRAVWMQTVMCEMDGRLRPIVQATDSRNLHKNLFSLKAPSGEKRSAAGVRLLRMWASGSALHSFPIFVTILIASALPRPAMFPTALIASTTSSIMVAATMTADRRSRQPRKSIHDSRNSTPGRDRSWIRSFVSACADKCLKARPTHLRVQCIHSHRMGVCAPYVWSSGGGCSTPTGPEPGPGPGPGPGPKSDVMSRT